MKLPVMRARRESQLSYMLWENRGTKKECTVCTLFLLMLQTTVTFASASLFLQHQMVSIKGDGICLALRGGHVHDVAAVAQMSYAA